MGLVPGPSTGQGGVRLGGQTPLTPYLCRVKPAVQGSLETLGKM